MSRAQRRQFFTQELSWSIPTKAAVDEIVTFAHQGILEVGAGKGLWAALIQKAGATQFLQPLGIKREHKRMGCAPIEARVVLHLPMWLEWTRFKPFKVTQNARRS